MSQSVSQNAPRRRRTAAERHPELLGTAGDRLLTRREVEVETSLSTATIYRQIAAGIFPRPRKVGAQAVRWRQSDVENWKARQRLTEARS